MGFFCVTAGEVRILYSRNKADALVAKSGLPPLTVHNITDVFSLQVAAQECGVFGYLSIENDLVILVVPRDSTASAVQVDEIFNSIKKIVCLSV